MSAAISGQSATTSMNSYELPGRAEIEKAARAVYELLTARQPQTRRNGSAAPCAFTQADAQYWQKAASLSEMLLGPVAGQLGTKRLLIVAEGALQYLPFGALPKPSRRRKGKGKGERRARTRSRVKGQGLTEPTIDAFDGGS